MHNQEFWAFIFIQFLQWTSLSKFQDKKHNFFNLDCLLIKTFLSDAPVISKVGPSVQIDAVVGEKLELTCTAAGSPQPNYQWLQQLASGEVLVRGYEPNLVIESVNYEHQGEFVCKANNMVGGEKREIQSEPIDVTVKGKPKISGYNVKSELVVKTGEDAALSVEFCANPPPKQSSSLQP